MHCWQVQYRQHLSAGRQALARHQSLLLDLDVVGTEQGGPFLGQTVPGTGLLGLAKAPELRQLP